MFTKLRNVISIGALVECGNQRKSSRESSMLPDASRDSQKPRIGIPLKTEPSDLLKENLKIKFDSDFLIPDFKEAHGIR